MKERIYLLCLACTFTLFGISQHVIPSKAIRNLTFKNAKYSIAETENSDATYSPNSIKVDGDQIGVSRYDLQSNSSCQNRIHLFPDGTVGGTWTYGINETAFSDRGTGYNYFNSSSWGNFPVSRIESGRSGWPSYAPWGTNGEIVVSHYSGASLTGLDLLTRAVKGVGSWQETNITPPSGAYGLLWPRMTTGGTNQQTIHLIALTTPVANGGNVYQGQDGALVYSRSNDGGASWDISHVVLDGLNSDYFTGISGDTYEIFASGNTVAILYGEDWKGLVLIKSTDNGDTWTRTEIWQHPYPLWDPGNPYQTDTFYCADGAHSLAMDNSGKIHVAFGINRAYCDGGQEYWFPLVDGIAYWNEDLPTYTDNLNALSPYGDSESELIDNYTLVGWMQDINNNGELDILGQVGLYYVGTSSQPQLVLDELNNVYLVYSSVTETFNNGVQDYRHLWARGLASGSNVWGDFEHITSDLMYIFSECVFPSCSQTSDGGLHFIFQEDNEPGLAVRGDLDPYTDNNFIYFDYPKDQILIIPEAGMVQGIVTDGNTTNPIEGALIIVEGTAYSANSNAQGIYSIANIPEGTYNVICEKAGYFQQSENAIIISGQTTNINFELSPYTTAVEALIGSTVYDLQSNASTQNRLYIYEDGTIGATWTMGFDDPGFADRGTGYNYFAGWEWEPLPLSRIESLRTGWPSYTPWGETGEMVVSHDFSAGTLILSTRPVKGTGNWTESVFEGPTTDTEISWNRTITSGTDNNTIHMLVNTWPVSNAGSIYMGLDGAVLYSRSIDGGVTWDKQFEILPGMTSSEYFGLLPDHYEWAEPQGNNLAFLVGDQWTDLFVMKSTDNGETWSKTVIWEHPYPMFDQNNPVPTDTFYCADGAHSIAFDNTGKIHIAFGITKAYAEGAATYYVKETDGVGYWNEDMASFSNNLNALNPLGGPGSEMIQDYNLIGWSQDINGNGTIDVFNDWGDYYLGMSSMPQLVIDDENQVFLFYSSVTEGYDNGIQNYRHIWARGSGDNGNTWGDFVDLNSDLVYIFSECIFPTCAARTTDKVHLIFMEDQEPGLAARGDMDPWGDNSIRFTNILKSDLINLPTTGTLSGTVENQLNGVPIQGALVEINGTAFSATTNASGFYTIDNIPAGSYIVTCSYAGYYNNTKTVVIGAGANTTQNFELQMVVYPSDEQIGLTYYDLQSNASMPNRIYRYPDGTIGATFTYGEDYMAFPDRGTGYNYFDGINWGPLPIDGIEPDRTGWPTYNPWGMEGEIIVSHYSGASEDGLIISSRPQKGTGNWGFQNFYGPQSNAHYLWPRSVTGGNNHSDLHVIALTAPTYNGGSVYQGMDGALLYSRSSDGGQTWDYEHVLLDGLNSDDYIGFSGDTYEIIARDNQVAFLVGDEWTGLVLMKSDDNGANWEKTVIWDHPYPMIDPSNSLTDTFYCVDGAHSLAFDNSGKVHVAFGIMRAKAEYASYIFPLVDGIGYWNEDMETFSSNLNALNPQGGPGSEMIQNYNLIGWMQDIDGNGSIEILDDFGTYYLGMSSMPQLVIDEYNNVFLFYSSLNEGYDNGIQNYRHIWARGSNDGGITWGNFIDINSDLVFIFSECVFPSCATLTDDNIHLIFMEDNEPGMAVRGDEDPYGINYIQYMSVPKSGFITINYGIFQGTVSDGDTGDPLEGATVEIEGTALTMMTGDNGQFFFPYVYPGNYEVICSLSGYATQYIDIEIEEGGTTNYNFELVPIGNLPPPTNLIGGVQGDDVLLVWNPPDTTGYNWLHWDNEENYDAVGLTSGGTFEIASRWEPSDLQPYDGYYLTKINFYLEEQPISVKLRVWTGENFSNLVVDQVVSSYFVQSWQTVTLDNPVLIDASEELCFGIEYNHEIGYLVAGIDGGPAIQEYGDMVNAGTGWSSLYVLTSGNLDGNWNLAGMVSTDPGGKSPAFTLLKEQKNSFNPDYSFSGKPCTKKTKSVKSTLDFLNYNIYRNSEFLATSQEPTYLDEDILPGEFSYYVTALYDDGESEPTNTFYIMAPYPCYPPESLQVNYIAPFIIEIIITGPSGGGPIIGYNLYRDGNYITSITGTTFWETNPLVGTYEYCVTTLCEDGESDPTCIEVIIEDPVLPPANLNAIVQDENILLEWTAPEYGSPDGYNIYYSFESSGFSMIAFVVDTAFTHLGAATLGLHEYYTTTVIDGEESEPSSTASVLIDITGKVLENNLRIFPNPATDKLYIKSDLNLISVKLLDMHGKEVSSSAPASIQYELNTTPFDNGLYLIQVITAEGAITKRIIIR